MATLTVKDIPDDLYESLKQLATANHRDIKHEIIACIEQGVRGRRIDPELVLERARKLREEIGGLPITDAELTKAKRAGRP